MRKFIICITVIFLAAITTVNAQTLNDSADNKTVGLALSGGGAKGLAYVGLLKLMDSLGIKVDYISGTSMGGILGALYAMGYSGRQIEEAINHIEWKRILSNHVPLSQVNIEEKDEYANYMIDFPVRKIKPGLPGSMIQGQYLMEVLNTYTYNARSITDFSKLPVPVSIPATDITNGEIVLQTSGSLPMAIRATMAIPAVFADVYNNGHLLVDGGLARNFPVEEVRNMGAKFVIGGYTGFRILKEHEIEDPMKMIMQTYAFNSVQEASKQMELTDILVDYRTALTQFSSSDFSKYTHIMQAGEAEAHTKLQELANLAQQQKEQGIRAVRNPPVPDTSPTVQYNFLNDRSEPLKDSQEVRMLKYLLNLKPGIYYPVEEINEAIHRVYGTRFYELVYYTFSTTANGLEMNVHVKQGRKGHFKAGVHFDTEQAAGILLNYTYYNLIFNRSRFLVTLDAAERMKARINYYKFLSANNKFWVKPAIQYRNIKSNDFLLAITSTTDSDNPPPDYFGRLFTAGAGLGYSFNTASYLETGLNYEYETIYRNKNLLYNLFDISQVNNIYKHNNIALYARFVQNSMSEQYYPAKGNKLTVEARFSFANNLKLNAPNDKDSSLLSVYDYLNPYSALYDSAGLPGNIGRIIIKEEHSFKLSNLLSLNVTAASGINSSQNFGISSGYLYLNNQLGIGGTEVKQPVSIFNFIGLQQAEIPMQAFTTFGCRLQFNPFRNFYLMPELNYGYEVKNLNPFHHAFTSDNNWFGYGLHLGFLSVAGPVDLTVGKTSSNLGLKFPWRVYFSLGFKF